MDVTMPLPANTTKGMVGVCRVEWTDAAFNWLRTDLHHQPNTIATVKATIEAAAIACALRLGNLSVEIRSSIHNWTIRNRKKFDDGWHVTVSTSPSGRSCHIYFKSQTDLTVRGESVMLNGELEEE
ncbi:hypothetical protein V8E54_005304 [Elaphomyces granulatus]